MIVLVVHLVADAVLVQLEARAAERVGFQHVGPGLHVGGVDLFDNARVGHATDSRCSPRTAAPPNSSGVRLYFCTEVPIAPSKINTRSLSSQDMSFLLISYHSFRPLPARGRTASNCYLYYACRTEGRCVDFATKKPPVGEARLLHVERPNPSR